MSSEHPCLSCGACCSFFRVSFYWREAESGGGIVPDQLTVALNQHLSCMKGTETRQPRCAALLGEVGGQVRCTIYEQRPGACRKFSCNGTDERYNEDCDRARAHYGLPPLSRPWPGVEPDFIEAEPGYAAGDSAAP